MLHFCERVVAIVDPHTTDDTVGVLEREFPEVEILWQDRSLGDSDYEIEGPTGSLIMHNNVTKFAREKIDDGNWVLYLAADERFHPDDIPTLEREIVQAKLLGADGLIHYIEYTFLYDEETYVDIPSYWISQNRFFKKPPEWGFNPGAHAGKMWYPQNKFKSNAPFYHFPRLEKITDSWVYEKHGDFRTLRLPNGKYPVRKFTGTMFDWRNMSEINGQEKQV